MFYRFGPYHLARLLASRKIVDTVGVEFTPLDHVYQWERTQVPEGVPIHSFFSGPVNRRGSVRAIYERAVEYLSSLRPDVVAITGWDTGFTLIVLRAAHILGIPCTIMSESQRIDFPRTPVKEWVKRRLVELYSSAVVGGQPHEEYMAELGMKREAIFHCMDAVDNDHFAAARHIPRDLGAKPMFLASARFIKKKNLVGLLTAYRVYRDSVGEGAWNLTILGDGPLKKKILRFICENDLKEFVSLPGFVQYGDLPGHYARGSAFILASTSEQWGLVVNEAMAAGLPVLVSNRCGCARDLVRQGVNGFMFDPYNYKELAGLMVRISSGEENLESMRKASIDIISRWGVEFFAEQLVMASNYAIENPAPRASALKLKGLDLLSRLV